jgi:hypothetical protein
MLFGLWLHYGRQSYILGSWERRINGQHPVVDQHKPSFDGEDVDWIVCWFRKPLIK